VLETGCVSKCACNSGRAGSYCQYSTEEFDSLVAVRTVLVEAMEIMMAIENPTDDAVSSWVDLLSDITNDPEVLSPESRESVVELCIKILQYAIEFDLSYDGLENLVDIIDLTLPHAYEGSNVRRTIKHL